MIVDDLVNGYIDVAHWVMNYGEEVSPRGIKTKEILGAQITLKDPMMSMPIGIGRGLNPAIGVAEACQLIAGESHPDLMVSKFPNFKQFTNGGTWFHGAYGPRIKPQIQKVVKTLHADPYSRQALMTIWDPMYDGWADDTKDTPCTISLQFFIRNNRLHMVTYMRSNDVWWGLAYDAYQFTMLQCQIAELLGCRMGEYHHHVGSLHLYERDWDKVDELQETTERVSYVAPFTARSWDQVVADARKVLKNEPGTLYTHLLAEVLHG